MNPTFIQSVLCTKKYSCIANLRETIIYNQLINAGTINRYPNYGDFKTGEHLIAVGGKNKPLDNSKDDYLIAADDIEKGYRNKIPLRKFGF